MRGRFCFMLLTLVWLVLPVVGARALIQAQQAACSQGGLDSEVTLGADTVSNTGALSIGRDIASGCASGDFLIDDLRIYAGALAQEGEAFSGLSCRYTYGLDLISQTRLEGGTPETRYYGYDGHGSVRTLIDASSGTITDSYDYDGYGMLLSSSSGSTPNNYRYSGEQWDQDLGAYYLRARYYKPETGRFWTMDTEEGDGEDPLSLHKYLYCKANPVTLVDPSGHDGTVMELNISGAMVAGLAAFTAASVYELKTHAIGNLMQAAWTETMTDVGSMEAAAESALSVARTSVRQLLKDAKDILKQLGRLTATVKVVPMPKSIIPAVANHVATAQASGYPAPLIRVLPATAAANRRAVLAGRGSAGLGQSWDEYPFASGLPPGMIPSVTPVPWLQNCIQGGIISGAYKIEKITPGTPYLVVVTP